MKRSLLQGLAMAIFVIGMCANAQAQQAPVPTATQKTHICSTEYQNVVTACKKGDRCSVACKQAHQAMKQCRVANNLPMKPHTGGKGTHTKCPKTPASALTPAAPQPAPQNSMPAGQ